MTVFIVCKFSGPPIAVFSDMALAHAFVLKQPGKYNAHEVEEMEVDAEVRA